MSRVGEIIFSLIYYRVNCREQELAKVTIKKEEVDLIVSCVRHALRAVKKCEHC